MYKVVEIFQSIDGEGIRTGLPVNFIRLAGCNLRCEYCDTAYALFGEPEPCKYREMTLEEICSELEPRFSRVTLTGGEPLLYKNAPALINRLLKDGYEVNVETNGAVDIRDTLSELDTRENLFFTIDYKLMSSGMAYRMIRESFFALTQRDVIKFVVGSEEDIDRMKYVMSELLPYYRDKMPHVYAGAVYGRMSYERLVEIIMNEPLFADVRFQIQLHKAVWDPDKRGV